MTEKPKPKPEEIEMLPDAWERFEKAVDAVMRSPPKPRPAKDRETDKTQVRKRSPDGDVS